MNEYALNKSSPDNLNSFQTSVERISRTDFRECTPERAVEIIEDLLSADSNLNKPHSLLVHQRAKLLTILIGAYTKLNRLNDGWKAVVNLICLKPYSETSQQLLTSMARLMRHRSGGAIVLLISCKPRLHIALATKEKLESILNGEFKIIIVVGQRSAEMLPTQLHDDILAVRANDNYESLPIKITEALQFIYRSFGDGTCCFKIDEDLPILNGNRLKELMSLLRKSNLDYAGFAGNNKENFERTWHFGKCEDPVLSRRAYGKRYPGAFAYGPFYYLSQNAINAFAEETLKFPDEILGHLYEDKFIGDTLREAGVKLSALSPDEWIPAVGSQWWTINRQWDGLTISLLQIKSRLGLNFDYNLIKNELVI
jgi:hypothetical protein